MSTEHVRGDEDWGPGCRPRPRVLISAFACEPGLGSEPGVGWLWSAAAAVNHDVHLLVPPSRRAVLEAALAKRSDLAILPIYVEGPRWLPGAADSPRGLRVRYALWQREAAKVAARLHARQPYDVSHHLTLGADWQVAGVSRVEGAAFVWGPVGSYTRPAWRLVRWQGPRWAVDEVVRRVTTAALRAVAGRALARRATIALAKNPDVGERLERYGARDVRVEPDVAIDPGLLSVAAANGAERIGGRRAVCVGRLLRRKGVRLALEALARPELRGWTLEIFGDGPDRGALVRRAERLGLSSVVTFHGARSRPEVLAAMATADVLVMPSLNDSSGFVVAEAVALGCPVVCLDLGGPPLIAAAGGGSAVPVDGDVPRALALAWARTAGQGTASGRWSSARLVELIDGCYRDAIASGALATPGSGAGGKPRPAGSRARRAPQPL